jgi:L-gulonate 3-dehydrogenase
MMPATPPEIDRPDKIIGIVGGGSIGIAFAIVFARAGHAVRLSEPDEARRGAIPDILAQKLGDLAAFDLIDEDAEVIVRRIEVVPDMADAVARAVYVQECAPEKLALKKAIFSELDRLAPRSVVLASASSAITASAFAEDLPGRERILVVHPGNPPFLIPVAEVVPAPFTTREAVLLAQDLLVRAGMTPVLVNKEVDGFVFNRMQGALLREAYCLVRDGVASVEDIDRIVKEGLGLRWSVIGPFETVDLNTQGGIASHAEKMGPAYARMGAERGQNDPWTPDLVEKVAGERRALLPLESWAARVAWRDRRLMSLMRHRKTELSA